MIGDQQWFLFGYDMRQVGRHWLAAWRDLLWGLDSPLRRHLDEVVRVEDPEGTARAYQSGRALGGDGAPGSAQCRAVALPAELVLRKRLELPVAVEGDLSAALRIEVGANSPFTGDDTAWGWRLADRGERTLAVELVIASRSAVMAYLGRVYGSHDPQAQEVWAAGGNGMVTLAGFGESRRDTLYRRRLGRVAAMAAGALVLVPALAAVLAWGKELELARLQSVASETERAAEEVTALRGELAAANVQLLAARELVARYPNPHVELARLTKLLGDEAWVAHFSADGDLMRIRGRARDAAAVMQSLSGDPAYLEVTAPQAISRVGNTDQEQFYLDIRVGAEAGS